MIYNGMDINNITVYITMFILHLLPVYINQQGSPYIT